MVYWYVWVAIQLAFFLLAELLRPKPDLENAKPAGLGDFQFPTATEGRVIPLGWGTFLQRGPNVVWYGDFIQEPITEEVKTGLFSDETIITGFRYKLGVQFALCRMAVDALLSVIVGDVEVVGSKAIKSATPAAVGSGYRHGEIVELAGGVAERPARVRLSVGNYATGAVVSVKFVDHGRYKTFPSFPVSVIGGSGTGLTLSTVNGSEITHGQTFTVDCPELFGGDELGSGGVSGVLQFFSGTDSQTASPYLGSREVVVAATPAAGGTGYSVGDVLTFVGGTGTGAIVRVVTVGGGGAVTSVQVLYRGRYTVFPASPASTTGGSGSGCTISFTQGAGFQSINGVVPRYLRTCYVVPSADPIYLGNSTSIKPWAFELRRVPNGLGLSGPDSLVNGADANPANVIYEVLTNQEWGLKQSPSVVDIDNFQDNGVILADEGNGFSFLLDRPVQALELLHLLEEQIDGVVFFDQLEGKWRMNLARGGYDVNTLPLLSVANISSLESFSRGAWEDTVNQVRAKYQDRSDGYKETSALAQDAANISVMQGRVVPTDIDFPGCKDPVLAVQLAWRALRGLSYPLAKAVIILDRTVYAIQPGQVVAWTYSIAGESFTRMPVRVMDIDYGTMTDGRIRLSVVQDVFEAAAGVFAPPDPTHWTPPGDALTPFGFELAFEAPRAFLLRAPGSTGPEGDRIWASGRRNGPEVGFRILERHAVGTPAGAYSIAGTVYQLMLVGNLQSSLSVGSAVPLSTLTVAPGPDSRDALEALVTDLATAAELGTDLVNLLLVEDEFMLATSAQTSGANVQLNGVYRGALDSVQRAHAAGTPVYLLSAGGGLSASSVPAGNNVDVKLIPFSSSDQLPEDAAPVIQFAMADRTRRPYPPSRLSLDGTAWASTTSMEANGSGPETYAIDISDLRRKDYRTVDEATALTVDAAAIFPDFPAANTTVHRVRVRNDPAGANTLLFTTATFSGTQKDVLRLQILKATDGVLPTTLRFEIEAEHVHESVAYQSRTVLRHDFSVTTALTGQFNFGALDTNDVSNLYTATQNGTYSFTLSSAFTAGDVEYRLNAGAWTTLIAAGGTSGSILGVVATDTIEVRHGSTDTNALKQLDMNAPGAGQDAYAILFV